MVHFSSHENDIVSKSYSADTDYKHVHQRQAPAGKLERIPVGFVLAKSAAQHQVYIFDSQEPELRVCPQGIEFLEIHRFVGVAIPANPDCFELVKFSRQLVFHFDYPETLDAGTCAYYRFRWRNEKGQTGPWSDVAFASIG